MEWLVELAAFVGLILLALGATSAKWLLDLCGALVHRVAPSADPVLLAIFLFLFVLTDSPGLVVAWAFATGRLPVMP
jgi:hypothetical protein